MCGTSFALRQDAIVPLIKLAPPADRLIRRDGLAPGNVGALFCVLVRRGKEMRARRVDRAARSERDCTV